MRWHGTEHSRGDAGPMAAELRQCPVCGAPGERDRPDLATLDATCGTCGWHYTSGATPRTCGECGGAMAESGPDIAVCPGCAPDAFSELMEHLEGADVEVGAGYVESAMDDLAEQLKCLRSEIESALSAPDGPRRVQVSFEAKDTPRMLQLIHLVGQEFGPDQLRYLIAPSCNDESCLVQVLEALYGENRVTRTRLRQAFRSILGLIDDAQVEERGLGRALVVFEELLLSAHCVDVAAGAGRYDVDSHALVNVLHSSLVDREAAVSARLVYLVNDAVGIHRATRDIERAVRLVQTRAPLISPELVALASQDIRDALLSVKPTASVPAPTIVGGWLAKIRGTPPRDRKADPRKRNDPTLKKRGGILIERMPGEAIEAEAIKIAVGRFRKGTKKIPGA